MVGAIKDGNLCSYHLVPFEPSPDSNGNEIDLIIELDGRLIAVEIKSGKTINQDFL